MTTYAVLSGSAVVRPDFRFGVAAVGMAVLWFALLQGVAFVRAGGVFEYPLDDVYIHLAMADSIRAGGYGVNPGEYASADSSPLYPFLLAPFAHMSAVRLVPLVLNLASLAVGAWMWGALVAKAGFGASPRLGLALAALGPVALNMAGVAFLGMEHALHAVLSLAVLLGLIHFSENGRIGLLLVVGVVLGPLVRLEGLAVSLSICLPLLIRGRVGWGVALGLGAMLPVLVFAAFLSAHGIGPLPNSVMAKLGDTALLGSGWHAVVFNWVIVKFANPAGGLIAGAALMLLVILVRAGADRRRELDSVVIAGVLVALAHLSFGRMGWGYRYEHYAVVFTVGAVIYTLGRAMVADRGSPVRLARLLSLAFLVVPLGFYGPALLIEGTASPRAINLQQVQMTRFAREWVRAPVAVNDIGRMVWRNPYYVLDLWGLASREALEARRMEAPEEGWADALAERHGADLAMIYDFWLGQFVGSSWVRLGELRIEGPRGFVAGSAVNFYATRPEAAEGLQNMLVEFASTLPSGAGFFPDKAMP